MIQDQAVFWIIHSFTRCLLPNHSKGIFRWHFSKPSAATITLQCMMPNWTFLLFLNLILLCSSFPKIIMTYKANATHPQSDTPAHKTHIVHSAFGEVNIVLVSVSVQTHYVAISKMLCYRSLHFHNWMISCHLVIIDCFRLLHQPRLFAPVCSVSSLWHLLSFDDVGVE